MKKRNFKFIICLIITLGIFIVFPNDVYALTSTESDSCDINNESDYGVIACEYEYERGNDTYKFIWHICSDGYGNVTYSTHHNKNVKKEFSIKSDNFTNSPIAFFDEEKNIGKCPAIMGGYYNIEYDVYLFNYNVTKRKDKLYIYPYSQDYKSLNDANWGNLGSSYGTIAFNNNKKWSEIALNTDNVINDIVDIDCDSLFGDKNDDSSLAWLIDRFFLYTKIIVPILVLLLSIVDFIKCIIINHDDDMKKAQKKLITRIILALAFFLIPSILSLLLDVFGLTSSTCVL